MSATDTIPQFAKMLGNLDAWLAKAVAFAEQRKFPPDVLAQARLAPDQYELARQVQSACDAAKFAAAYLSGEAAPSHPDTETTVTELRARVATCLAYLRGVGAEQLAGFATRRVAPPWLQGKWMRGDRYLTEVAIPNFYFHVTTAYAILRHNGVELGKMDYIGGLPIEEG
ncbi:MAG: DUF1993 domain-containing protein [bacterium]|nr:DUF1993 domain-containing protein [bacterium]